MDLKFGIQRFLGSLITNPNSKLRNSKWRIQYCGRKCKTLLDWYDIGYLGVFRAANNDCFMYVWYNQKFQTIYFLSLILDKLSSINNNIFIEIKWFLDILSTILSPLFCISRIWRRIHIWRPQRPSYIRSAIKKTLCTKFNKNWIF